RRAAARRVGGGRGRGVRPNRRRSIRDRLRRRAAEEAPRAMADRRRLPLAALPVSGNHQPWRSDDARADDLALARPRCATVAGGQVKSRSSGSVGARVLATCLMAALLVRPVEAEEAARQESVVDVVWGDLRWAGKTAWADAVALVTSPLHVGELGEISSG